MDKVLSSAYYNYSLGKDDVWASVSILVDAEAPQESLLIKDCRIPMILVRG